MLGLKLIHVSKRGHRTHCVNLCCVKLFIDVKLFTVRHWDDADSWNPSLWKTETCWSYTVKTMSADVLLRCWSSSLQWRNDRDGISNHQHLLHLLNCWFRRRSKKTSKFHVTDLCVGNSPVTGEFPTQKASNMENVSIWWCHHVSWIIRVSGPGGLMCIVIWREVSFRHQ